MKLVDIVPKQSKLRKPDPHTEDPRKRFPAERKAIKRVKDAG